ncbi:hypothetical protein F5Y15DRAFT_375595 [Xylariaceae sp. FL0016]|nr:hypothetical protein F5Y15DRAFT_375595 [Xylariaceae sp. FL0016]
MPSMDISIVPPPVVSQPVLLGILWSGSIFSLLVLSTRLEIRRRIYSTLKTDDYLVICAWVLSLATTILWTILRDDLYASLAAADSVASLNEVLDEAGTMLRGMLASDILSWTCLWSVKLSFMAFFYPLGKQIKSQRMLWWGVIGFILIGYLVCVGTLDYECLTSRGLDILNICSKRRVIDWEYAALRTITAMDVVTDALIVMVPGSIVWRVHIAWRKKLALTGICCLTIVMIVAAILRIAICSTGKKPDVSWWLVWNSVETTLGTTAPQYLA